MPRSATAFRRRPHRRHARARARRGRGVRAGRARRARRRRRRRRAGADPVKLVAGANVQAGDAVVTGAASHAQIRFADDGLVALKPDTEFRIETYVYNGRVDGNERAVFRLVRGGFRTVTGQIGKVDHDRYSVVTTQATIGIRGTHFVLQECIADECRETPASTPYPPGAYCGVLDGRVAALTPFGNAEFGLREYFFVPPGAGPQRLIAPPTFLADNLKGRVRSRAQPPPTCISRKCPSSRRASRARRAIRLHGHRGSRSRLARRHRAQLCRRLRPLHARARQRRRCRQPVQRRWRESRRRDRYRQPAREPGRRERRRHRGGARRRQPQLGPLARRRLDDRADAAERRDRAQRRRHLHYIDGARRRRSRRPAR